jgi:hypothetical protein
VSGIELDHPPGKREQTKAANRAAILTAAREVFADIGFGAASVRDIVRRDTGRAPWRSSSPADSARTWSSSPRTA